MNRDHSSAVPSRRSASPPHSLRMLQRGGATESPQATLIRRHGVRVGDPLCAAGYQPDRSGAVRRPPRRGRVAVFRPGLGVASAATTASTARCRSRGPRHAGCVSTGSSATAARNAASRSFLVRVGRRQPENPMLVPARGQRVDQRLDRIGISADEQPGRRLAGFRSRRPSRWISPSGTRSASSAMD